MNPRAVITISPFDAAAYGRRSLIFIWIVGAVSASAIIIFLLLSGKLHWGNNKESRQVKIAGSASNAVDELLLGSDDAFFSSNKAFMNAALGYRQRNDNPSIQNPGDNRANMYRDLFNQRLERARQQSNGGFSIRPVPK